MTKFLRFLEGAAARLKPQPGSHISLVLGNDAADLDSIVSSLSYAFLRHSASNSPSHIYLPLISIPRADLALRTEATFALDETFPTTNLSRLLVFEDDIDLGRLSTLSQDQFSLILTDHNRLSRPYSHLASYVSGIIDHHKDDGLYQSTSSPRIIAPVGSCTSLVVHEWINFLKSSSASPENYIDSSLARLLLSPILIDTVNLDPAFNRVTDPDIRATEFLLPLAFPNDENRSDSATRLFRSLQSAKLNITSLSSMDLLRKDYKEWDFDVGPNASPSGEPLTVRVGISSVTWHFHAWVAREGNKGLAPIIQDSTVFAKERGLDCHMVMTAFDHGESIGGGTEGGGMCRIGFQRELFALFRGNVASDLRTRVINRLEASELNLEKGGEDWCQIKGGDGNGEQVVRFYVQRNTKCSRKQVQPIVQRIIEE